MDVLELMRAQRNSSEEKRREKEKGQERREEEARDRIRHMRTKTEGTEVQFSQQRALLLSQLSDLDQQILKQDQDLQSALETTQTQERERKDIQLSKLVSQKEAQVEVQVKAQLLGLWAQEQTQSSECFSELTALLDQSQDLWTRIKTMKNQEDQQHRDMDLRRTQYHSMCSWNKILTQEIESLSQRMRQLNRQKFCLSEQRTETEEQTHKLSAELSHMSQDDKQRTAQIQALEAELRMQQVQRRQMEGRVKKAVRTIQDLLEDPQRSPGTVQKLSHLFGISSCDVTDAEFTQFTIRQFYGTGASEERLREESERSLRTLTDPQFLLKCLRKGDVGIWPCSSWDQPRSALRRSPCPSRSDPVSPVQSLSPEPLSVLEKYQENQDPSSLYDM